MKGMMKTKGLPGLWQRLPELWRGEGASLGLVAVVATALFVELMLMLFFMSRYYHPLVESVVTWRVVLRVCCDVGLLTAPWLVVKGRRRGWSLPVLWIVSLWCLCQSLYDITYNDMMPLRSFTYWRNVNGVLLGSVWGNIVERPGVIWFVAIPAAVTVAYFALLRKRMRREKGRRHWLLALLLASPFVVWAFIPKMRVLYRHKISLFFNGPITEVAIQVGRQFPRGLSADERAELETFLRDDCEHYTTSTGESAGKNVVFIVVESLNSWSIDMEVDGRAVAPTLKALLDNETSLKSRSVVSQACNGRSSDGLFCYMTGLLPLRDAAVAMEYPDGPYVALPQLLKRRGYATCEVSGDRLNMWNVETMTARYGYDSLYYYPDMEARIPDFTLGDRVIMKEAAARATTLPEPFFLAVLNVTTHSPYNVPFAEPSWISQSEQYTPAVRGYLERLHYFDTQLAAFLSALKASSRGERTVVVVVSDHDAGVEGEPETAIAGARCVFAVAGGGVSGTVPGAMGQVDVFPTMLDLLGLRSDTRWQGLGHSVLRDAPGTAVGRDGKVHGTAAGRDVTRVQRRAWDMSEMIITHRYEL